MPAILLKNVPKELKERIEREAQRNRRSMQQQIMLTLEQAFGHVRPIRPSKPIKPDKPFTHEWLMKAIRDGRR